MTMDFRRLSLKILPERMAVCRFDPAAALPDWIAEVGFYSITRTEEELTIVCPETHLTPGIGSEAGWRCFQVRGLQDFSEIGIIFSLTRPLAANGIPVFVISTFNTDYLMVKDNDLAKAVDALSAEGHVIILGVWAFFDYKRWMNDCLRSLRKQSFIQNEQPRIFEPLNPELRNAERN
jgi:hypothetical protein